MSLFLRISRGATRITLLLENLNRIQVNRNIGKNSLGRNTPPSTLSLRKTIFFGSPLPGNNSWIRTSLMYQWFGENTTCIILKIMK